MQTNFAEAQATIVDDGRSVAAARLVLSRTRFVSDPVQLAVIFVASAYPLFVSLLDEGGEAGVAVALLRYLSAPIHAAGMVAGLVWLVSVFRRWRALTILAGVGDGHRG